MAVTPPRLPTLTLSLSKSNSASPLTFRMRQGDKGYVQPFELTDTTVGAVASSLGFRASKPDGQLVDIRQGFVADGTGFVVTLPAETFTAPGEVSAYIYMYEGDTILASSETITYRVDPQLAQGLESTGYSDTLDTLTADMQSLDKQLSDAVAGVTDHTAIAALVDSHIQDLLAEIDQVGKDADATVADKKTALDKLQTDFNAVYNTAQADLTALEAATTAATTAAGKADASSAKADASAAKADTAAADAKAATAGAKDATTKSAAQTALAQTATVNADTATQKALDAAAAMEITDADLAAWVTQEAGE